MTNSFARHLRRPQLGRKPAYDGTGDVKTMGRNDIRSWSFSPPQSIEGVVR